MSLIPRILKVIAAAIYLNKQTKIPKKEKKKFGKENFKKRKDRNGYMTG